MTGISLPGSNNNNNNKDQTPSQKWKNLKKVPERYSIIQLGICLFHRKNDDDDDDDDNTSDGWRVRRYNFYMFPAASSYGYRNRNDQKAPAREIVLNPSTAAFLRQNNMSFDVWASQGIAYQTEEEAASSIQKCQKQATRILQDMDPTSAAAAAGGILSSPPSSSAQDASPSRRRVQLMRSEDIEFHARTMASLREWLDVPITPRAQPQQPNGGEEEPAVVPPEENDGQQQRQDEEGCHFLLPPCNSFLRRALYESIQQQYPSLTTESAGNNQIRVLRMTDGEKRSRMARLLKKEWESCIVDTVGVWRIFEALSAACRGLPLPRNSVALAAQVEHVDWETTTTTGMICTTPKKAAAGGKGGTRRIPIVVHNGFMDFAFLFTHFISPTLPEDFTDYKRMLHSYFPIIYDTKVIASQYCTGFGVETAAAAVVDLTTDTRLQNLYQLLVREQTHGRDFRTVNNKYDKYTTAAQDQEHQADYDAYMTGAVFVALCQHVVVGKSKEGRTSAFLTDDILEEPTRLVTLSPSSLSSDDDTNHNSSAIVTRSWFGRNLFWQPGMYVIDLELSSDDHQDPFRRGLLGESVYRVSDINSSTSTRDIVRCLSGLVDAAGQRVHFEIVWVDDTTFLVAACYKPAATVGINVINGNARVESAAAVATTDNSYSDGPTTLILKEHGRIILEALQRRFNRQESIITLEEYLRTCSVQVLSQKAATTSDNSFWMARWLSGLYNKVSSTLLSPWDTKKRGATDEAGRGLKRRRVV